MVVATLIFIFQIFYFAFGKENLDIETAIWFGLLLIPSI